MTNTESIISKLMKERDAAVSLAEKMKLDNNELRATLQRLIDGGHIVPDKGLEMLKKQLSKKPKE